MGDFKSITTGSDWSDKDYLAQIEHAFYEKGQVFGVSLPAWAKSGGDTAAGTDIQSQAMWKARQDAFGTLISGAGSKIVRSGSHGSPPGEAHPNFVGSTTVNTFSTESQLWGLVTGNTGGPRRRTSMTGYPSSGWSHGKMTAGDIIGPWLIQDLQLAHAFTRHMKLPNASCRRAEPFQYNMNPRKNGQYSKTGAYGEEGRDPAMNAHDASSYGWQQTTTFSYFARRLQQNAYTQQSNVAPKIWYASTYPTRVECNLKLSDLWSSAPGGRKYKVVVLGTFVAISGYTFKAIHGGAAAVNKLGVLISDQSWQTSSSTTRDLDAVNPSTLTTDNAIVAYDRTKAHEIGWGEYPGPPPWPYSWPTTYGCDVAYNASNPNDYPLHAILTFDWTYV